MRLPEYLQIIETMRARIEGRVPRSFQIDLPRSWAARIDRDNAVKVEGCIAKFIDDLAALIGDAQ